MILQKADTHGLCHSVLWQTNVHIYTHMPCEMNAGSHKLCLFRIKCANICPLFISVIYCKVLILCCIIGGCFIFYYNSVSLIDKIFYIAECVFVLFLLIFNPPA